MNIFLYYTKVTCCSSNIKIHISSLNLREYREQFCFRLLLALWKISYIFIICIWRQIWCGHMSFMWLMMKTFSKSYKVYSDKDNLYPIVSTKQFVLRYWGYAMQYVGQLNFDFYIRLHYFLSCCYLMHLSSTSCNF